MVKIAKTRAAAKKEIEAAKICPRRRWETPQNYRGEKKFPIMLVISDLFQIFNDLFLLQSLDV